VLDSAHPDAVIQIINASALERHLYLTLQLIEMGIPVAVGLNMIDESDALGLHIDAEELSQRLGVPVVPTVARSGHGLAALLREAAALARSKTLSDTAITYGKEIDDTLARMSEKIAQYRLLPQYTPRFTALRIIEND
jgi:ferrous iron transport protein B